MPTTLNVTHTGPRDSVVTVILIHGVDSDSHVWDSTIDLLSSDIHCVAVDLPGHGGSAAPDNPAAYKREAVLDDIDDVVDRVRTGEPSRSIVLVGHSLGGYLGLAHVLTREGSPTHLDGLVLVSTGPGFRDPSAMKSWNERVEANRHKYQVSEVAASIAYHVDSMVIDRITEVTVPVALVVGDGDRAFLGANDYLEKKLPHCRRTTVEGGRHFVMKSHPESVADAVRSVATEVGAG